MHISKYHPEQNVTIILFHNSLKKNTMRQFTVLKRPRMLFWHVICHVTILNITWSIDQSVDRKEK